MEISERMERWIKVSVGLARFEPEMMPLIQNLGRIDVQLFAADDKLIEKFKDRQAELIESEEAYAQTTASYLWILGSYEAIRTLDQRAREMPREATPEVCEKLTSTKLKFARLRVPLAKMEAARAHRATDSHIAFPGFHLQHGVAWRLNEELVVSRSELSEAFLATLEFVRKQKLQSYR